MKPNERRTNFKRWVSKYEMNTQNGRTIEEVKVSARGTKFVNTHSTV